MFMYKQNTAQNKDTDVCL